MSPTWITRPRDPGTAQVAVDVVTADHVEDDVDPVASGKGLDRFDEVLLGVVDDQVGAQRPAGLDLAGRRGDDDAGPDGPGQLNGRRADARRAGVDERRAPRRQPALHDEGVLGGEEDLGHRGRVSQAQLRRDREDLALVGADQFGVRPAPDDAHDLVALRPGGDPLAEAATRPAYSMPGISCSPGGPG